MEKPLALTVEQLAAVREEIASTGNDRIMVGFNRRLAQILVGLREAWAGCGGPQVVHYTVNAGPLDAGSWYGQTETHGSRFAGEGGHFIDTFLGTQLYSACRANWLPPHATRWPTFNSSTPAPTATTTPASE